MCLSIFGATGLTSGLTRLSDLAEVFVEASHDQKTKNPSSVSYWGFLFIRCLAMTYSHMGTPHTTIGDDAFHD